MKSTHVANGSHHAIWAMCDRDRNHVTEFSTQFVDFGASVGWRLHHIADSHGFTKILPGTFTRFNPGNTGQVYISIFYQEGVMQNTPGPLVPVCSAFVVDEDHSVVVDLNNQVRNTQHGRIWVDIAGNNHFRQPW